MTAKSSSNAARDKKCKKLQETPLKELFTEGLRQQVRRVYAKDFKHLGDALR